MPILICLKNPQINLVVEGDIKDESEKRWDEIFNNQILMVKRQGGLNMVIPLLQECNIAFLHEVTQKEIDEGKEEAKKRKAAAGRQGSVLTSPHMIFPSAKGGRS